MWVKVPWVKVRHAQCVTNTPESSYFQGVWHIDQCFAQFTSSPFNSIHLENISIQFLFIYKVGSYYRKDMFIAYLSIMSRFFNC